jgi:hypothetical protein
MEKVAVLSAVPGKVRLTSAPGLLPPGGSKLVHVLSTQALRVQVQAPADGHALDV